MSFLNQPQQIVVLGLKVHEDWIEQELQELLPGRRLIPTSLGWSVKGDQETVQRLNLRLQTGRRVLSRFDEFRARNLEELQRGARRVPWDRLLYPDRYLTVNARVEQDGQTNSRYISQVMKDCIVDQLRARFRKRPDSGPDRTGAVVFIHWKAGKCTVYADTSGPDLAQRGYRLEAWKAPLRETLAANIVRATGWKGQTPFLNPMCGSGTLAIEAALMAGGRAPGLQRQNFGFFHLRGFNHSLWKKVRRQIQNEHSGKRPAGRIIASDISPRALRAARANADRAGVGRWIDFIQDDFAETPIPEPPGVILMNPNYGERLGEEAELVETYERIGDWFKQKCAGYTGFVFTGSRELSKSIRLRTSKKQRFFNASIECRLLRYELYSGSRKEKHGSE